MTQRLSGSERRSQLLDTALEVFGEQGFNNTSMSAIAAAAGVTKPVLYQHFGSKRELFLELLRALGSKLREEIATATVSATSPREQVEAGFRSYFRWVEANRHGFEVLFAGETRRDTEFTAEAMKVEEEIAHILSALIAVPGMDDDQRSMMAYGIVGMAETTCRHWLNDGVTVGADELATQVALLAWAGLRGLHA